MRVYDLYSRRNASATPAPIPEKVRTQVCFALQDCIGFGVYAPADGSNPVWFRIHEQLLREYGQTTLTHTQSRDPAKDCCQFLMEAPDDRAADVIELAIAKLGEFLDDRSPVAPGYAPVVYTTGDYLRKVFRAQSTLETEVAVINTRFRQENVQLQFVGRQLVRTDSDYLHREVTEPAFALLHNPDFEAAELEFKEAHDDYRHGRWDDAINKANHAFESTMKCALELEGSGYDPGDNASRLVDRVLDSRMFAYLGKEWRGKLKNALEGKLPPMRNLTGHGAGRTPRKAEQELAAFALHSSAANIVLVVSALEHVN